MSTGFDPEAVALFRYKLIAEAANPEITGVERGLIVRGLACYAHVFPDGSERMISRQSLDRWVRAYRAEGLSGLRPVPRSDVGAVRANTALLAEAAALRAELPARSSAQIADIIWRRYRVRIAERTIRAHLRRRGLHRAALGAAPRAFGRYEAERANERWITDVLIGPFVPHPRRSGSRRAKLFVIVDDYSRLLVHGCWVAEENTRAGQAVLRAAIDRRGLPQILYADNGAPFSNAALERSCAVLGVRLVHSRPYSPAGRGKQERLNRYIRQSFLAEMEDRGIGDFAELNEFFMAWAEQVCNTRVHEETREAPIKRFLALGPPQAVHPAQLAEAFRWSVIRVVSRTAMVSLSGNRYLVEPSLVGRRVELRYDPEDLSRLEVFDAGQPAGMAVPFVLGRHVHPQVPQAAPPSAGERSGVDYLGMVLAAHDEATSGPISYREVPLFDPDRLEDDDAGDQAPGGER